LLREMVDATGTFKDVRVAGDAINVVAPSIIAVGAFN